MLESFGFDVNKMDNDCDPCIIVAIRNQHYAAVRWLVQHGADCNLQSKSYTRSIFLEDGKSPISWLASYPNVPLDLFDILKTSENLNTTSFGEPPLHTAISHGHTESALHLIELGANVMHTDKDRRLPIDCYIRKYTNSYEAELFTSLIPSRSRDLLRFICEWFSSRDLGVQDFGVSLKMLQQLLQRLVLEQPISVTIDTRVLLMRMVPEYDSYLISLDIDIELNQDLFIHLQSATFLAKES